MASGRRDGREANVRSDGPRAGRQRAAPPAPLRTGLLLGAVLGTCGLGLAASTVVLLDVGRALDVRTTNTAWVVACFSLGLGVGTLVCGRLIDLISKRRVLYASDAAMLVGVAACVVAPGFAVLLLGRILVGVGAGGLCSLAFVLGSAGFPAELRGRVAGVMTATAMAFIGAGPLLGALAMAVGGWRLAVALPGVSVLCAARFQEIDSVPPEATPGARVDVAGVLLVTTVAALIAATLQAPGTGAGAIWMLPLGALATAGAALLIRHVRAHPAGFLPAEVFRRRQFLLLNGGAMTLLGSYAGMLYAAPALLAVHPGWRTVTTGFALAPAALGAAIAATTTGRLLSRWAPARVIMALCGLAAAGLLVGGVAPQVPVAVILATTLTVSAFAAGQAAMQVSTPELIPAEHVGVGLGIFNFLFITGAAIGTSAIAGLSSLFGLPNAVLGLAALPCLGGALSFAADRTRVSEALIPPSASPSASSAQPR